MKHVCVLLIIFSYVSCNSRDETRDNPIVNTAKISSKQLNINILWDLSDRIDPVKNPSSPEHYEKDIAIIQIFTELFKKEMDAQGAYKAKGKFTIFFTPTPNDENINRIARALSVNLGAFKGENAYKQKKAIYDSITQNFSSNANMIYQLTLKNNIGKKDWDGSDIWRFFKNDVKIQCVESDSNYRNILVILTDGYIYHKDSQDKEGNKTAYILPNMLRPFRNNKNWKELFVKNKYGLIAKRNDLQNLEVLVLEITPSKDNKNDEDIIKEYLSNWFTEMGIRKFSLNNSTLPEYTKKVIDEFMNNK